MTTATAPPASLLDDLEAVMRRRGLRLQLRLAPDGVRAEASRTGMAGAWVDSTVVADDLAGALAGVLRDLDVKGA